MELHRIAGCREGDETREDTFCGRPEEYRRAMEMEERAVDKRRKELEERECRGGIVWMNDGRGKKEEEERELKSRSGE